MTSLARRAGVELLTTDASRTGAAPVSLTTVDSSRTAPDDSSRTKLVSLCSIAPPQPSKQAGLKMQTPEWRRLPGLAARWTNLVPKLGPRACTGSDGRRFIHTVHERAARGHIEHLGRGGLG